MDVNSTQHDNSCFVKVITLFFRILFTVFLDNSYLNICTKARDRPGLSTKTFPANDFNAAAQYAVEQSSSVDVYFEVCLQKSPPESGKRGNASGVKLVPGLWLDIDIKGPNHKTADYPSTWEEALHFVFSTPWSPSLIVCSGGGLHAYYLFETPFLIESKEDCSAPGFLDTS